MAVNNPDGSSVTVNQPPDPSGAAPATGLQWVTKVDADFTSVGSTTDWLGAQNGSYPAVGGVGWGAVAMNGETVAELTSRATEMSLTPGVGVRITCGVNPSNYIGVYQDSPRVVAPINQLIPGITAHDTVCFQAVGNCSEDPLVATGNWSHWLSFGLSIGKWGQGHGGNNYYSAMIQTQAAGPLRFCRAQRGTLTIDGPSLTNNFTFFEAIIGPDIYRISMSANVYAGVWPAPGTTPTAGQPTVLNLNTKPPLTLFLDPSNTYVGVGGFASTGRFGSPFTFTNFRALRLE